MDFNSQSLHLPTKMILTLACLFIILPCVNTACCLPDTWHALKYINYDIPTMEVLYSFPLGKYMLKFMHSLDTAFHLFDLNDRIMYKQKLDNTCTKRRQSRPQDKQCPFDDADSVKTIDFAGEIVNVYEFRHADNNRTNRAVTKNGCIPVYETFVLPEPRRSFTMFYTNFTSPALDLTELNNVNTTHCVWES